MPLTRRQREIFDYSLSTSTARGTPRASRRSPQQFGFQSLATVHEHLTNLERKGYIRRTHNESRAIEIVPPEGPDAERPSCRCSVWWPRASPSRPSPATTPSPCPTSLIPRRGRSYVLKVRGTSMIDEHIRDGDFVVVHERNQADNGEMVIALVHGNHATVKKFYREPGGWIRLQPANAEHAAAAGERTRHHRAGDRGGRHPEVLAARAAQPLERARAGARGQRSSCARNPLGVCPCEARLHRLPPRH